MEARPSSRLRRFLYRELLAESGPFCHYCGVLLENSVKGRRMTLDHYVPLSRGGSSDLPNLVLCCITCNGKKDDLYGDDFKESIFCRERRATIQGNVAAHRHLSVLFVERGNWSCICGAHGTRRTKPKNVPCIIDLDEYDPH